MLVISGRAVSGPLTKHLCTSKAAGNTVAGLFQANCGFSRRGGSQCGHVLYPASGVGCSSRWMMVLW